MRICLYTWSPLPFAECAFQYSMFTHVSDHIRHLNLRQQFINMTEHPQHKKLFQNADFRDSLSETQRVFLQDNREKTDYKLTCGSQCSKATQWQSKSSHARVPSIQKEFLQCCVYSLNKYIQPFSNMHHLEMFPSLATVL